jgi:hypothetical protein
MALQIIMITTGEDLRRICNFFEDFEKLPATSAFFIVGILLIDDVEINNQMGNGLEVFKINGQLKFANHFSENEKIIVKEIIEAIETALRKPLLWMLDRPKRNST